MMLKELKIVYDGGETTKTYGVWQKIAERLERKYSVRVPSEKLRKKWKYLYD